ncbi:tetratricopeptide repeat protein [Sporomusa acidovorans]|uniref:TPR repeat-containing protein YrrB n=1 Tax=Sporomusa acidovorans (strain ATCC 49682 / DSM 3132 / Mol) TaxID=1123286 RepID=A0ABZ3J8T6_SPOA4|nr:tetratricopeptide repeat-containing glycosyltransferase family protein [Sporomusa acidovorans]OZC16197.1 TPR repeat-containing protein YrrB [Sporomusa acidovorans DSM 3132]SDE30920.1 Tetratricopeptide repeat-containing protein [Sporomusa acidovorans]
MPDTNETVSEINEGLSKGMQAVAREEWEQAIACFLEVLKLKPDSVEALNNLGAVFKNTDRLDYAEACLCKAIEVNPNSYNAFYNLGTVYEKEGNFQDAAVCFRQAIELDPYNPDLYNTLGVVLEHGFHLEEAEQAYLKAIALKSDYATAYYNLGLLYAVTKRLDEGEKHICSAHELEPAKHAFTIGLAFHYLKREKFEQGWTKYAEALALIPFESYGATIREWCGEDLTGKSILLYAGEGLGDALQFVRYTSMVAELAAHTTLWVQEPLQRLVAAHYPQLILGSEQEAWSKSYDYFCSLQALPIYFKSNEQTIPRFAHYLQALSEDSAVWQQKLAELDGGGRYRVGVVWSGNIYNPLDLFRSIPFAVFNQLLLAVEGISWISLQVGSRAEDYKNITENLLDLSPYLTDFGKTAAVIEQLDLVITTDTSVAHLSGALGQKTWLLLDVTSDWRWFLDREDSPWYPSMRLFRQREAGNWPELLARVATSLRQEMQQPTQAAK